MALLRYSYFLQVLLMELLLVSCCIKTCYSQGYGASCDGAGNLTSTVGIGAGFAGLIDSPLNSTWWHAPLTMTTCDNSVDTLNAIQQWVWYFVDGGVVGSYFYISTSTSDGADADSVESIIWTSSDCSSKSQCSSSVGAQIATGSISGILKLAIGQFATSQLTAKNYPNGKTHISQHCVSSCADCLELPAKLFYPNQAASYTRITSGSPTPPVCAVSIQMPNYYTFKAHSSGTVLVSTCTLDGATKTHSLATSIIVITGNCNAVATACGGYTSGCETSARATFTVTPGKTYTIMIGSSTLTEYDGIGVPVFNFQCADGTYDHDSNQNTACVPCTMVANCISPTVCTPTANSGCNACFNGFYLNNGTCSACTTPAHCKIIIPCSTATNIVCAECNDGYYMDKGVCVACTAVPNCNGALTCSTSTDSVCASCIDGYFVTNAGSCASCKSVPNCNSTVSCTTFANSVCPLCSSGYFVDSTGHCTACSSVSHCNSQLTCSTDANSVCTSCDDGFYVNSGSCSVCTLPTNCSSAICSSETISTCTVCHGGSYLSSGSCPTCSALPNCVNVTCSSEASLTCNLCAAEYILDSGSCKLSTSSTSLAIATSTSLSSSTSLASSSTPSGTPNNSNNNNNNSSNSSSFPIAVIAGAVGGAVFLLILIIIVALIKKQREKKRNKKNNDPTDSNSIPMSSISVSNNLQFTPSSNNNNLSSVSASTFKDGAKVEYDYPRLNKDESNSNGSSSNGNTRLYEAIASKSTTPGYEYSRTNLNNETYEATTHYTRQVLSHASIKQDIILDKVLGNGSFGVVKLGRIRYSAVPDYCKDLIPVNSTNSTNSTNDYLPCAVKTLKEDSDEKSKRDFAEEGKMMANFNHPNVIRVIAVLLDSSPSMLVTELMKYGDLKGVLEKSEEKSVFWHEKEFLFVTLQIAKGMEYLQSIRFIHRDLAARNCLVSDGLTVKISDFGLSKELEGEKDYYRLQTKGRLPVKWMAPEAIGFRRFTHATDVWSFGVVMWEVFSYAHMVYEAIPPRNLLAYLEKGDRLQCPSTCYSMPIVYEWMLKCWEYNPSNRPSFSECVQFLSTQMNSTAIRSQEIRNIGGML